MRYGALHMLLFGITSFFDQFAEAVQAIDPRKTGPQRLRQGWNVSTRRLWPEDTKLNGYCVSSGARCLPSGWHRRFNYPILFCMHVACGLNLVPALWVFLLPRKCLLFIRIYTRRLSGLVTPFDRSFTLSTPRFRAVFFFCKLFNIR